MAPLVNGLVARLPRPGQKALLALCEPVDLVLGAEVHQPDLPQDHVYFPLAGYLSLISARAGMPGVEVGMIGPEGMSGAHLALGVARMPLRVIVQGAGSALRLPVAALHHQLAAMPKLEKVLQRYAGSLLSQFATAAPCMRFHSISPRLARWLLMTQDRVGSPRFHATHEFLSYMLGVRRAGVTVAAGALQQLGAIRYERGEVTVLDRQRLEQAACSCYEADRQAFSDAMGDTAAS